MNEPLKCGRGTPKTRAVTNYLDTRRIAHVWALEVQTGSLVPSPSPTARALILFEFCDAPFNDLGEAYGLPRLQ